MELKDVIQSRRSVTQYDPAFVIDDAILQDLFESVRLTPSSFNLQHWKFVVVRDAANKKALRAASWNQAQMEEASAVIVVCGYLRACKDAERIYSEAPPAIRDNLLPMIRKFYEGNDHLQRDEAVRSGSLAAMTLMLAASDMGLATGPIIGFDPAEVTRLVGLDDDHFPVMMVVIGKQLGESRPRAYRFPVSEFVRLETIDGEGFGVA